MAPHRAAAAALLLAAAALCGAAAYETTPPTFSYGPKQVNVGPDSFEVAVALDEPGIVYVVALASGSSAPTSAQVKALTDASGAAPVASGLMEIPKKDKTYNIRISTFTSESTPTAPTTYDIYVVAEDANRCPVCADPYNNGCTETCQTTCTTGLCPSPNIQGSPATFTVVIPYRWRPDLGPGYPKDFGTTYGQPISFAVTKLDGGSRRRQLLGERELLAFSGEITETIGTFGTPVNPYTLMTQRHKAGHALVQWEVDITFDKAVDGFDYTSLMTAGCFVSAFEAQSDTAFKATLTACDPQSRGVSPENNLEHISGRMLKLHGNMRADAQADGGGQCVLRVHDASYTFKPPVDKCPTTVDDEGGAVQGGQTDCGKGVVIPNMASDPLRLQYTEFVAKCPAQYSSRHRTAQDATVLSDTLSSFAATFKDIVLI